MMKRGRIALFVSLLLAAAAIGAKAQVLLRGDAAYWTYYYVTLTLAERTVDENGQVRWVIRDKVEFDGRAISAPRRFLCFHFKNAKAGGKLERLC